MIQMRNGRYIKISYLFFLANNLHYTAKFLKPFPEGKSRNEASGRFVNCFKDLVIESSNGEQDYILRPHVHRHSVQFIVNSEFAPKRMEH